MDTAQRISRLEQRLAELEAKEGIRDTIARYARSMDFAQYDEMEAIFTDDLVFRPWIWWQDEGSADEKAIRGKAAAIEFFRNYIESSPHRWRYVMNERIDVQEETGQCSTYYLVLHSINSQSNIAWGTYEWGFRKEGIWKISYMKVNIETMTTVEKGWAGPERVLLQRQPH